MKQIDQRDFPAFETAAQNTGGDPVYPCSVTQGYQSGDLYAIGGAVLFHHYCGFAYLSGETPAEVLEAVRTRFLSGPQPRRFVLITDRAEVIAYFRDFAEIAAEERLYFRADTAPEPAVPAGFSLKPLTADLMPRLSGRIIPAFSWESDAQFLRSGFGYCLLHGEEIAACAFSAAVTANAADIGVETAEAFRRKGLAACAAAAVMQETLRRGKTPVWACHAANTGSAKTAEKLGFRQTHTCTVLHAR